VSRTVKFEVPVDTGFFTPIQVQPRILTSLAWNALARWLRAHVVSPSLMVEDHRIGLVVLGFQMQYDTSPTFLNTEALSVQASLSVRSRGKRLVLDTRFADAVTGEPAANLEVILLPVRIDEPQSLAAEPAELSEELLARFAEDEIKRGPTPRYLHRLASEVRRDGELISERSHDFVMHRHLCEVADQWAWYELPCILECTREPLAFEGMGDQPLMRRVLSEPLKRSAAEFTRPYYWSDRGRIQSRAYAWRGQVALVHELQGQQGRDSYGTAVEIY